MKCKIFTIIPLILLNISCSLNEDANNELKSMDDDIVVGFDGMYTQEDRVGRPAINTALILPNRKEAFNLTVTKDMKATFSLEIEDRIKTLSPAYNTASDENALGQTSTQLANLLADDVLTINLKKPTTFFDGTNVLTGRKLDDDVIDTALLLIFGGENGLENPELSKDKVNSNDKAFRSTFPYAPRPW